MKARWWHRLDDGRVQCDLCPRDCKLHEGQRGFCFVRAREGDELVLTTYGRSSGFCVDPIEKKPLHHFFPGSAVLSFGTAGCNLGCRFCQNWDISKATEWERLSDQASPEAIAELAGVPQPKVEEVLSLEENYHPASLDQELEAEGGTIRYYNGSLLVNAPDYMHRQIAGYPYWPSYTSRVVKGRRYVSLNMDTSIGTVDGFARQPVTAVVGGRPVSSDPGGSTAPAPKPSGHNGPAQPGGKSATPAKDSTKKDQKK